MLSCADCEHAAHNSGGVYCTFFTEQIRDESVADQCGEYAGPLPGLELVPAAGINASGNSDGAVLEGAPQVEAERSLTLQVELPFFGRPEHGDSLLSRFTKLCRLHFNEPEVTLVDPQKGDVHA